MSSSLGALRTEYEQLSTRMNRVAILTLSVMALLVLGLTNAIQEVRESADYRRLLELQRQERGTKVERDLLTNVRPDWMPPDEAGVREKVEAAAKKAYSHEVGMLGARMKVDLRQALLFLPAILLASALYLLMIWFKREAAQRLGEHLLPSDEAATEVDRLYFAGVDTAYAEFPGRLGWWCFLIAMSALLVTLRAVTEPIWRAWEFRVAESYTSAAVLVAGFAFLYAARAGLAIDDHVALRTGRAPFGGLWPRIADRAARSRAWLAKAWRTRVLGLSAGSIVLLTLITPLGFKCVDDDYVPATGWAMLTDPSETFWLTSLVFMWPRRILGVVGYVGSLLLAIVSIYGFAFDRAGRRIGWVSLSSATIIAAYTAIDIGLAHPLTLLSLDAIEPVIGDLGVYVLESFLPLFFVFSILAAVFRRRPRMQSLLRRMAVLFVPIIASALAGGVMLIFSGYYGYTMYLVGLIGLVLAWFGATQPSSPPSTGTSDR